MGYLPNNASRREAILIRKRQEYKALVEKHFGPNSKKVDESIYHQISIDVPRTCPELELFRRPQVKDCLIRILYCWSIRRPASGYVQGINDLVTPFFLVFYGDETREDNLEEYIEGVEADTFWCFSKLLDSIQDNYTASQSGIHRQIGNLKEIVSRIDPLLYRHLEKEHVNFVQFAFRWMNCLLHREFPLLLLIRLFDTYMAGRGGGFFQLSHFCVCSISSQME